MHSTNRYSNLHPPPPPHARSVFLRELSQPTHLVTLPLSSRANKRFARDLVNLTVTKPYKHPDVEEERKSSLYILRSRRDGGERTKHKDCFARGDVMEYIQGEREILELSFHSEREERERNFRALVSL